MNPRNLYVTAMEPESGKSIVGLGLMELLSRRVERLGFFRPIVPEEPDPQLELMRSRYDAATAHALTSEEAGAAQPYDELRKAVVAAYKPLEADCDFVLCEGTDFTGAAPALDFGLNADFANELGAPVLVVVRGGEPEQTAASVRAALGGLATKGCVVFGVVVNRVPAESMDGVFAASVRPIIRSTSSRRRPSSRIRRCPMSPTRSVPASSSADRWGARFATCGSRR